MEFHDLPDLMPFNFPLESDYLKESLDDPLPGGVDSDTFVLYNKYYEPCELSSEPDELYSELVLWLMVQHKWYWMHAGPTHPSLSGHITPKITDEHYDCVMEYMRQLEQDLTINPTYARFTRWRWGRNGFALGKACEHFPFVTGLFVGVPYYERDYHQYHSERQFSYSSVLDDTTYEGLCKEGYTVGMVLNPDTNEYEYAVGRPPYLARVLPDSCVTEEDLIQSSDRLHSAERLQRKPTFQYKFKKK